MPIRHFRIPLAGESYKNDDGSSRQKRIRQCSIGEELIMEPEPDNEYDPNALKVARANGRQIGYIPMQYSSEFSSKIANGWPITLYVASKGRMPRSKNVGMMMLVVMAPPGTKKREIKKYRKIIDTTEGDESGSGEEDGSGLGCASGCLIIIVLFILFYALTEAGWI